MESIAEELFRLYIDKESLNGKASELVKKLSDKYIELSETLNAEQKKLLNEIEELTLENQCEEVFSAYKSGFKSGMLLMLETLKN